MNLTPEQLELLLCLLGALTIGFLFGYFLSRSYSRELYESELEEFSELLDTRDREIESASAQYGQLKQHMIIQSDEIKMKEQQIVEVKEVVGNFENNAKYLNEERIELESLLLQKDMKIGELNEEISFSKNELNDSQNLLNEYKELSTTHDEKLLSANNEIEQNAKLSHALVKQNEEQLLKFEKLEKEKEKAVVDFKKQADVMNVLKLENQTLSEKLTDTIKSLEESTNQVSKLEIESSNTDKQNDDFVQTLTRSSKERDNAIDALKKQAIALNELKLENQSLNSKLINSSKLLEEHKVETVDGQNKEFNVLQQKLEDTQLKVTQKDTNIANLEQTISSLKTEAKNIQNKLMDSDAIIIELQNVNAELEYKDNALKSTEEKLHLSQQEYKKINRQLQSNIANEQAISQLSGNDNKKEGWGITKLVKDMLGNTNQKKDS